MKAYYVKYKMYSADKAHGIQSPAENKIDAYEKAVYTLIPEKEGGIPYSAWVSSVTYKMADTGSSARLKGIRTKDPKKTCKTCKIILDLWKIKW